MATRRAYIFVVISLLFLTEFTLISYTTAHASPVAFLKSLEGCQKGQKVRGLHKLKSYLARYGYLEESPRYNTEETKLRDDFEMFDKRLETAIKTYQQNHGISVTGRLDASTIEQMMKPRCGVPDIINGTNTMQPRGKSLSRKSRLGTSLYALIGSQWPPNEYQLTYRIQSSTLISGAENMESIVASVLKKWAQYSPFSFQEVSEGSVSNLVYGFYSGDHGDGFPFDGPGGTLAHSFSPTDGRSHYDASESWSDDPDQNQMDLESVVLHETGHLLGLAHSSDLNAVMYPSIAPGEIKRDLEQDDIDGIEAIYGS